MKHASKLLIQLMAIFALSWHIPAKAASHREAPLISMDPTADNTDVYAFVSYDAANLARAPTDPARHVHSKCKSRAGPERRPELL